MKRFVIPAEAGIQEIFLLQCRLASTFGFPWIPDQRRYAAVRNDETYGVDL